MRNLKEEIYLKAPSDLGSRFKTDLFNSIAESINILGSQTNKWPNLMTFTGQIGFEVKSMIENLGWNLDRFEIKHEASVLNKIIVGYSKDLDLIEDIDISGNPSFISQGESINGKIMNGIPSKDAVHNLISQSMQFSFKKETKIRPSVVIHLTK